MSFEGEDLSRLEALLPPDKAFGSDQDSFDDDSYDAPNFPTPRDFQTETLEKLRAGIRAGHRRQVLMAPTGSGKTFTAMKIIHETLAKGNTAMFVADRTTLINQASAVADLYGLSNHGIIQADHWRKRRSRFQIASVQTLARRGWPKVDVLILDECHTFYKAWTEHIPTCGSVVIGLSATPFTKGLGKLFSNLVVAATMDELTRSGVLVPMRIFACKKINMEGAKTAGGEWTDVAAEERGLEIIGDVVTEWTKFAENRKTIVFGATIAHCEAMTRQFNEAGITAAAFTSETTAEERATLLNEYQKPDSMLRVLISVEALAKGFDCLDSETEILTPSGWRGMGEISKGDSIYGYDRESGKVEACECEWYGERPLRVGERMVKVKSQRFNIRTTEGHRFHIKYRDPKKDFAHQGWLIKTAAEMVDRRSAWGLPLSGLSDFQGVPLSDDELRLIAWFMTDGSLFRRTFQIVQSKPFKNEIRDLLVRLGIDFTERTVDSSGYPNAKPAVQFNIPKGTHKGSLARNGWVKYSKYLDKNVSPLLMQMTREQFRVFWAELLKGDGAKQGNKAGWLWCDRKEQADAYTHLAVVRGFSASFSTQTTKLGKLMYVVSVRDAQWIGTSASPLAAKFSFDQPRDGEKVWCVSNRLSTLIARRGGKIAVIGNCPDVEVICDCRPLRKSLSTAIQMWGRGLRSAPGKTRATLLDFSGNMIRFADDFGDFYYNGLDKLDSGEALDKKIRREDEEPKGKKCPQCGYQPCGKRCVACGYERVRQNLVEHQEGEMFEFKVGKATVGDKLDVWQQAVTLCREQGKPETAPGRAAWLYKSVVGVFPRNLPPFESTPDVHVSAAMRNKLRSNRIAYRAATK